MKPLLLILVVLFSATVAAEISEPMFDPIPYSDPCSGNYHGQIVKWSCPVCGRCNPENQMHGNTVSMTAMYCECGCCNTMTIHRTCANGQEFWASINECDRIEWGLHYILIDGDTMYYKGSFDAPSDSFLVKGNYDFDAIMSLPIEMDDDIE